MKGTARFHAAPTEARINLSVQLNYKHATPDGAFDPLGDGEMNVTAPPLVSIEVRAGLA